MTDIHVNAFRSSSSGRSTQSGGQSSWLNDVALWGLVLVVALLPIPFGGARALYYEGMAVVIGGLAAVYFALALRVDQPFRIGAASMAPQMVAMGGVCLWLIIQMLPVVPMPLALYDGTTIASDRISVAPGMTLLMLLRQISYGLFFFLVVQMSANRSRRRLLTELTLWIVILYGVYGLVSLYSGDTILGMPKWAYSGYVTGTFVNRNSFATFLALGGTIAAGRVAKVLSDGFERHRHDGRMDHYFSNILIYTTAYAFLFIVVLLTGSRMGTFVISVGGVLSFVLGLRRAKHLGYLAVAAPVALAGAVIGMVFYGQALLERFSSFESSAADRGELYRQIWSLILQRPLTGFGGGAFEPAFQLVHAPPLSSTVIWSKAHNTYLAIWSELGLVAGTLLMLAVALVALRMVTAVVRKRGDLESQSIGLGAMAIAGIHSLVDFSLEIPAVTLVFLVLIGTGLASSLDVRTSER